MVAQIIPLLKLIVLLGLKYKVEILNNMVVKKILGDLLTAKTIEFTKLKSDRNTMYIQCLLATLKLSQMGSGLDVSVLDNKNVQNIVAMAINNGNKEQKCLALALMKAPDHFSPETMAEVRERERDRTAIPEFFISFQLMIDLSVASDEMPPIYEKSFNHVHHVSPSRTRIMSTTVLANETRHDVSEDDFARLFNRIQTAYDTNKLNVVREFDFVKLYEERINILNKDLIRSRNKLEECSADLTYERHKSLQYETSLMRCTEMVKSLRQTNEL